MDKKKGKMTTVEEKIKEKEKLIKQIGEEKVAELEAAEGRPIIDMSSEEVNKFLALSERGTETKKLRELQEAMEIGKGTTKEQEEAMLEEATVQRTIEQQEEEKIKEKPTFPEQLLKVGAAVVSPDVAQTFPQKMMPVAAIIEETNLLPIVADFMAFSKKFSGGFISDKRLPSTKDVMDTFQQGNIGLADELEKVRQGRISIINYHFHLRKMNSAINQMESRLKLINRSKAAYWVADGKDIEEALLDYKRLISSYNIELIRMAGGRGMQIGE